MVCEKGFDELQRCRKTRMNSFQLKVIVAFFFSRLQLTRDYSLCSSIGIRNHMRARCEGDFADLLSLYHGFDLLTRHGLLVYYNYIKELISSDEKVSWGPFPPDSRGALSNL